MTTHDYATLAEAKAALPQLASSFADGSQDALLTTLITSASRAVDRRTNRPPGSYYVDADTTRYFDGPELQNGYGLVQGSDAWLSVSMLNRLSGGGVGKRSLWIDEMCGDPTSVAVAMTGDVTNYTVWPSTDYFPYPYNYAAYGRPFIRLDLNILYGTHYLWYSFPKAIKIIGLFGFSQTVPGEIKEATIIQTARWFKRALQGYQDKVEQRAKSNALAYASGLDNDVEALIRLYRRQAI